MAREELQKIIDQLVADNLADEAIFGILQYGGGPDESYIKANKQGLELFAVELLRASKDAEDLINKNEHIVGLDDDIWLDGDVFISYIQLIKDKRDLTKIEGQNETWKDVGLRFGCVGLLGLGFILMIIGLITTARWIF